MSNQAKCTSSSSRKYSTTCHLRNENKSAASDNENENTTEESKETGEAAGEDADGTPTEITDSEKIQKLESQLKDMKDQLLVSISHHLTSHHCTALYCTVLHCTALHYHLSH